MSQIFTHWKCEHCGNEFNQYVSFGHPDTCFDYEWQCEKCGKTNTLHVSAMSRGFDKNGKECPICGAWQNTHHKMW